MKLLPCRPDAPPQYRKCSGYATAKDGKPMRIGRAPEFRGREPFRYKCDACKLTTQLRAEEFARIPEATLEQLREAGLGFMVESDLRGAGATDEEIESLVKEESLERGANRLRTRCSIRASRRPGASDSPSPVRDPASG